MSSEEGPKTGASDEDWCVECSDSEMYGNPVKSGSAWTPPAEEIAALYLHLEKCGVVELEWQCPGRQAPLASTHKDEQADSYQEEKPEDKSDFDFFDEPTAPRLGPRRTPGDSGPKGSAKKKTTSLDGILSNIRRHRQLDEMEDEDFG